METIQDNNFQTLITYYLAIFYSVVALFYSVMIKIRGANQCNANLVNIGKKHSLHWWNHVVFRVFRIAIWAVCIYQLFDANIAQTLIPFTIFINPLWQFIGVILMLLGFTLAIYCNFILDNAWRSGLDTTSKPGLVTRLLYARSRNPSYIGVAASQLGFFLAWPNLFSFICLLVGVIALRIQIRLEETFLSDLYNEEYQSYIAKVPRYF